MWSSIQLKSILFLIILLQGFCYSFDEANVIDLQPESSDIFPLADSSPSDILDNNNPAAISSSSSRKPATTTPSSGYTTSSPSYCGIGGPQFDDEDEEDDDINSRIVGGSETRPNEFPWQAFVRVTTETGLVKYCGGSLIANRWILTANHCLRSPGQKLKSVTVYLGAHDITSYEMNRRQFSGMQVYTHPDWNQTTLAGDIALIKLYSTVTFSRYIRPTCLANPIEPDYVNTNVVVTGWGKTTGVGNYSVYSPVLRKTTVPVITNNECRAVYGNIVTSKIMCTSGSNYRGMCRGDDGGPMNYRQPNNGRWKQIGIVSFYPFRNCQNGNPSGYTRLSYYSNWIRGVVTSSNGMSSTQIKTTKPANTTPVNTTPGNTTPANTTPGNTTPANTTPSSSSAPTSTSPTSAAETSSVVSFLLFVYSFVVSLTI